MPTNETASRWNKDMDQLETQLRIIGFSQVSNYDDVAKLATQLMELYHNKNLDRNKIISPNWLRHAAEQVTEIYALKGKLKRDLKKRINDEIRDTMLDHGDEVEITPAPCVPIPTLMMLAWKLWDAKTPVQTGAIFNRRAAATALAICTYTGNRWIDTIRLRWEDMTISQDSEDEKKFIFFKLRITKSTDAGLRPIWASMYENGVNGMCPFELLSKWWIFTGKKKHGFMFFENRSFMNGTAVFYQVKSLAVRLQLDPVPRKHSPRNTLVATLFQMGFSLEEIRRRFNWTITSEMPIHYLKYRLDKLPNSVAAKLAQMTKQTENFDFQSSLI